MSEGSSSDRIDVRYGQEETQEVLTKAICKVAETAVSWGREEMHSVVQDEAAFLVTPSGGY